MQFSQSKNNQTGATSTGVIGGVLVLALAVVVSLYFLSDVFRTKADAAVRGLTKWTPENIATDPVGYLDFAETQAKETMTKLKASEISVKQRTAKLQTMKTDKQKNVDVGDKALEELKGIYRKAEAESKWPVAWKGQDRDRAFVRRQIVNLNREVESSKNVLSRIDVGLKKLEVQVIAIQDARAKCQSQITEIQTNREMLKVQAISEDLKEKLVDMKGVLTSVAAAADESTDTLSLDDLASGEQTKVADDEFDKIMGEKK